MKSRFVAKHGRAFVTLSLAPNLRMYVVSLSLFLITSVSLLPSTVEQEIRKNSRCSVSRWSCRASRVTRATNHTAKTRILVPRQYDTECHLTVRVNTRRLLLHLRAAAGRMAEGCREQHRREVNTVPRETPKRGTQSRSKARRGKENGEREREERKRRRSIARCHVSIGCRVRNAKKESTIYGDTEAEWNSTATVRRYFPWLGNYDGSRFLSSLFVFSFLSLVILVSILLRRKSNDFRSDVSRAFCTSPASSSANERRGWTRRTHEKRENEIGQPDCHFPMAGFNAEGGDRL